MIDSIDETSVERSHGGDALLRVPEVCAAAQTHPSAPEMTAKQNKDARNRLNLLLAFVAEVGRGKSANQAVARIGVKPGTFWGWLKQLKVAGVALPAVDESLTVARTEVLIGALATGLVTGRPMKYALDPQAALVLRSLVLDRSTEDATHFALAVEEFATHPSCPPKLAEVIRAELERSSRRRRMPNWPLSIRRAGMPTKQEAAWWRGEKHSQAVEQVDRRGLFWIDEGGHRLPLGPHTIVEMDDASDNEPRRSIDPDTGEQILTRQALWTQDVYSAALLYLTQVARPRDAYRIEDVAEHVLSYVEAWGLPTIMRLEMGRIWNGRFFHGFTPCEPGTTHVLPGWPEGETWGGLQPLCRIVNVHKSKGKGGMEGSFNLVQAMAAHRSLSIGRSRGEFEDATKALVQAHRATEIDERFWDMDLSAEGMKAVAERFNLRPKIRRAFGRDAIAPVDLLRGAKGAPLLPSDLWMFCPVKQTATVRGGHIQVSVDHYPRAFRFRVNGVDDQLHLDDGYTVLVAFHPGRPQQGCWVFNAEMGVRNRDNLRRGAKLILAPHAGDVAQVDFSGRGDFSSRKKSSAAVRRAGRAIGQAQRRDYAQDSEGRSLLVGIDGEGQRHVQTHAPQRSERQRSADAERLLLEQIAAAALERMRD